ISIFIFIVALVLKISKIFSILNLISGNVNGRYCIWHQDSSEECKNAIDDINLYAYSIIPITLPLIMFIITFPFVLYRVLKKEFSKRVVYFGVVTFIFVSLGMISNLYGLIIWLSDKSDSLTNVKVIYAVMVITLL